MAKLIRCVEGHIFETSKGQCPVCGWCVPEQKKLRLSDRLMQSLPSSDQFRRGLAAVEGNAVASPYAERRKPTADADSDDDSSTGPATEMQRAAIAQLLSMMRAVLASRSAWAIISIAVAIGFLAAAAERWDSANSIYGIGVLIVVVVAMGLKYFLRSKVSSLLVLFATLSEYGMLSIPIATGRLPDWPVGFPEDAKEVPLTFWSYWAYFWKKGLVSPLTAPYFPTDEGWGLWKQVENPETHKLVWKFISVQNAPYPEWLGKIYSWVIGVGVAEDVLKLLPVILLLTAIFALKRAPPSIIPDAFKSTIESWARLDRATAIVMLAVAGGAGFVLAETLGSSHQWWNAYLWSKAYIPEFRHVQRILHEVKMNWPGVPIKLSDGTPLTPDGWDHMMEELAIASGLLKGVMLVAPRTLGLLIGHGAYAGIAAYYLALARRQSQTTTAIALILFGILLSASLHASWDSLNSAVRMAPLAIVPAVILLAVCVQAMVLDQRSGLADEAIVVGDSMLPERRIPDFPAGNLAAEPKVGLNSPVVPTPASAASVGTLVLAGSPTVPGRRITLQLGAGRVDLAVPDIAFEVNAHPTNPERLGLKNIGTRTWTLTMPDGRSVEIATGKTAALADKAIIDFGPMRGRIERATG